MWCEDGMVVSAMAYSKGRDYYEIRSKIKIL